MFAVLLLTNDPPEILQNHLFLLRYTPEQRALFERTDVAAAGAHVFPHAGAAGACST